MTDERYEELVVRSVDGLTNAMEQEELMTHLLEHPEHRREYEQQLGLKALTDGWVARLEQDVLRDQNQAEPAIRTTRWVGQALVLFSLLVLTGGGTVEVWADAEAPLWLKVGFTVGALGSAILLAVLARERHSVEDPYAKVIR